MAGPDAAPPDGEVDAIGQTGMSEMAVQSGPMSGCCIAGPVLVCAGGMFAFKRRNPKVSTDGDVDRPPRFFRDGISALRYACKFLECPLQEGAFLPAVVLDPRELFGTRETMKSAQDPNQLAFLCVASSDGGFFVAATTAGAAGPRLEPGQLVAWKAVRYLPDIANTLSDRRFGWLGTIVGTLKPEHRNGCWVGIDVFRPAPAAAK